VVRLTGPAAVDATTDALGRFALAAMTSGDWLVVPSKVGDANGAVSALDAAYVLQAVRDVRALDPLQRWAADVDGDGVLTDLDAILILRHSVDVPGRFPAAEACGSDWLFVPAPAPVSNQELLALQISAGACRLGGVRYAPLVDGATDQDFDGVLFGDVTGNW